MDVMRTPGAGPLPPAARGCPDNRRAWRRPTEIDVPPLTAFSDGDPIMAGVDRVM